MDGNQIENTIQLGQSVIVDQGVAVGALIFLFITVVLFIMILWRVLGNQRQDNKDQGVLVSTVGNLANIIEKFDQTAARFADMIEEKDNQVSEDRQASNAVLQDGITKLETLSASNDRVSESVDTMKQEFDGLKQQVTELVNTVASGVPISEKDKVEMVEKITNAVSEKVTNVVIDAIAKMTSELKEESTQQIMPPETKIDPDPPAMFGGIIKEEIEKPKKGESL